MPGEGGGEGGGEAAEGAEGAEAASTAEGAAAKGGAAEGGRLAVVFSSWTSPCFASSTLSSVESLQAGNLLKLD